MPSSEPIRKGCGHFIRSTVTRQDRLLVAGDFARADELNDATDGKTSLDKERGDSNTLVYIVDGQD